MKLFNFQTALVVSGFLLALSRALIVDTNEEIICDPDSPSDCYPRLFVPTAEWQAIKPGQDIPPGLHVRMNVDTLTREAKILDPNEDTNNGSLEEPVSDLVVSDISQEEQQQQEAEILEEQKGSIQQKIVDAYKDNGQVPDKPKPHVSIEDLNDYESAVNQLSFFFEDRNTAFLSKALDVLVDLSHDIEFGMKLSRDQSIFDILQKISHNLSPNEADLKEKIFRIMGSTLRNNPEAVKNVLDKQSSSFMDAIFVELSSPENSDVIKKRILGVIQGLTSDDHFNFNYFHFGNDRSAYGISQLINVFPRLEQGTKLRLVNILEDIKIIDLPVNVGGDKKSKEDSVKPDNKMSAFLQDYLRNGKVTTENQFKLFFTKLVEIHRANKNLRPEYEFLEWLSAEASLRVDGIKPNDQLYSRSDDEFDQEMLKVRHEVFGNPNAYRKAIIHDEL